MSAAAVLMLSLVLPIQAPAMPAPPQFDVASVKQNRGEATHMTGGMCYGTNTSVTVTSARGIVSGTPAAAGAPPGISPGTCVFRKTTLREIIAAAYGVPRSEFTRTITGGPRWLDTDLFDIDGKADGARSQAELQQMLQALLADRFGLRLRRETRDVDGFELVAAPRGPRLKAVDSTWPPSLRTTLTGSLTALATPMPRVAVFLTSRLNTPVVDATGLTDRYDFTLEWTPGQGEWTPLDAMPPEVRERVAAAAPVDAAAPSIFTALEEQLGLRLRPRKVPMDLLVIDAVHPPTAN